MSLLPNKYVPIHFSSVGVAAVVLKALQPNDTVSTLWQRLSADEQVRTFNRFADALTVLYAASVIEIVHGSIRLMKARSYKK